MQMPNGPITAKKKKKKGVYIKLYEVELIKGEV